MTTGPAATQIHYFLLPGLFGGMAISGESGCLSSLRTGANTPVAPGTWGTGAVVGEWHGVEVDDAGRVTHLNLSSNQLKGEIPAALGQLSQLQRLSLYKNGLSGKIPPELGQLSALAWLDLSHNRLTGSLPAELQHAFGDSLRRRRTPPAEGGT